MAPPRPPAEVSVMAASSTDRRLFGDDWVFERKLDGYRCLAWVDDGGVRLRSRNGLSFDDTYPEVARALAAAARGSLLVDGEVVAMVDGQTSFEHLQQKASDPSVPVQYVVFDLLWFDGNDIRPLPLEARQAALAEVLVPGGPIALGEVLTGDGEALLAAACGLGWEGLIAKRRASAYQPRRSKDWLKLKCVHQQEVVVGGFTEPKGSRTGLGALLVGVYEGGELRYAGKVGTGFDTATLHALHRELHVLARPTSPFAGVVREKAVHWVEPTMVVEVGFGEWTASGHLRHPRYLGKRPDKDAREVTRER
ncbi:MAG TPA: non-homologous end-joining DNA ligase [Acidimicrobiales bacterium]|nr:non-homologous end-joining DNA ligase [Acidimicrobiales bacterium]